MKFGNILRKRGNGKPDVRGGREISRLLENLESRVLMSAAIFNVSPTTIVEGDQKETLTMTATLNVPTAQNVQWSTSDGTAKKGTNYTATSGSQRVAAKQSFTIKIPILANPAYQPSTTFYMNLSLNNGVTTQRVPVTILDHHVPPTVTVQDVSVNMGTSKQTKSNSQTVTIPVTLSNTSLLPVVISYTTVNGTAVAGSDYRATKGTLTIAPGKTVGNITVTALPYTVGEAEKVFGVQLLSVTNGSLAPVVSGGAEYARVSLQNALGSGLVVPNVTVADATATAGGNETFQVTLSKATKLTASFRYRTVAGTATTADYTPVDGVLTIPAGATTGTITVAIHASNSTANTHFSLALSAAANANLTRTTANATIINVAPQAPVLPTLGVSNASVAQVDQGTSTLAFTVTLSSAATSAVTVNYATTDGTAVAGTDYTAANGILTFAPGDTSKTVDVTVLGNYAVSLSKTLNLTLSSPSNATISTATGVGTILNNNLPGLSIGSASAQVINSDPYAQTMSFTVTLSTAAPFPVAVNYATANLVAAVPGNGNSGTPLGYTPANGTLTFAPGETSKTITVTVHSASVLGNQRFDMNLSDASNATISSATAMGTISYGGTDLSDNTQEPYYGELAASNSVDWPAASFTTGSDAQSLKSITVPLELESPGTVSLMIYSDNGGVPGSHLATLTSPASFSTTSHAMTTFTASGITLDPNTTYWVLLQSSGTVGVAAAANTTGTGSGFTGTTLEWNGSWSTPFSGQNSMQMQVITADAGPGVSIGSASVTEQEGNITNQTANFTVSLSNTSSLPVTVNYSTSDVNAVAGTDYTAANGTLTFEPGETSKTISITVTGDSVAPGETFNVTLSNATNASISTATGVGTIQYSGSSALSIGSASVMEIAGNVTNETMAYTVTLDNAAPFPITVHYATGGGTAVAGTDYTTANGTLTIPAGQTSGTINITVHNVSVAPGETFNVTLSNATNATLSTATGVGTINYDAPIDLSDNAALTGPNFYGGLSSGGEYAQSFATGASNVTLSNVALLINEQSAGTMTAMIYSDSGGHPGTLVGTLTSPASYSSGSFATAVFTASNMTLNANTTYWVVATANSGSFAWRESSSTGTGTGFLAANEQYSGDGGTSWSGGPTLLQMQVNVVGPALPVVSIAPASVVDVNGGTATMTYTVTLDNPVPFPVTVHYATSDGTAIAGTDYTAANGTLTIPGGQTSGTISIAVTGVSVAPGETFNLTLSNATNATISTATGVGTINYAVGTVLSDNTSLSASSDTDIGFGGSHWVAGSFATGPSSANLLNVSLFLAGGDPSTTAMIYSNSGGHPGSLVGTLTSPGSSPFGWSMVTFSAESITLNASTTYWVVVNASNQDMAWGGSSSGSGSGAGFTGAVLQLSLIGGTSWQSESGLHPIMQVMTGAVSNGPNISIAPASVTEVAGNITAQTMTFTVTLDNAASFPVTVHYVTADGTAAAGTDYTAANGTLTFAPGQTSKTISVTVTGDSSAANETLSLNLSNATNGLITAATGLGTIIYTV
jgi:hypothetical protein